MAQHNAHEDREEKRQVADVFSKIARTYGQVGPGFFTRFGARLTEVADVRPGQTVLDVACGRGASLLPAARRAGPRGEVLGVDLSQGMVDELGRDIRARGLDNADVRLMDAEHLTLPTGAFDHVLAGFCVYFFPHLEQALAEMRRVLKPGGRLTLSTWGTTPLEWRWVDDLIGTYLPEAQAENEAEGQPPFADPGEMHALAQSAGLVRIEVVKEAEVFTYADGDEWWDTMWSTAVRDDLDRIEARVGVSGLAELEAKAREHLRAMTEPGATGIREVMNVLYTRADKPDLDGGRELAVDATRLAPAPA